MPIRSKKYYYLFAALLLLLFAEGAVRVVFAFQGYTVGSFAPNWFPQVNSGKPIYEPSYFTDSTALFRANKGFWQDRGISINSLGFRGNEWFPFDTSKPRVLLIGDSFVWGAGAEPLDSSFTDRLASINNLTIYNAGIPGADPAQYQLLAEQYLPLLKPDIVVVCLYMGNDVVGDVRIPMAGKALYYPTNKGWFPGYYNGQYFDSFETSYQYYLTLYSPQGWFQKLVCHTAIGTAIYSLPIRLQERRDRELLIQSQVTNQHLLNIRQSATKVGAQLYILPIPYSGTDYDEYDILSKENLLKLYPGIFNGVQNEMALIPLQSSHFHSLPDGHFNNKGHALFADSLKNLLLKGL